MQRPTCICTYGGLLYNAAQTITSSLQQSVGTSQFVPVTITQQDEVDQSAAASTDGECFTHASCML